MARHVDADKLESKLFRDGTAGIFVNKILKDERIAPAKEVLKKEDMTKDTLIEELADDILQEFSQCHSEEDQDRLARMLLDAWNIKQCDVILKALAEAMEIERIISDEAKNRANDENFNVNFQCEMYGMQMGAALVIKGICECIKKCWRKNNETKEQRRPCAGGGDPYGA